MSEMRDLLLSPHGLKNDVSALDMCGASFRDILQWRVDKYAPLISKKVKGRLCSWLTLDVKKEISIKDGLLRKACRTDQGKRLVFS